MGSEIVKGSVAELPLWERYADQFPVREKATQELEQIGPPAEGVLRKVLDNKPSLEAKRRIEALQAKADQSGGYMGMYL